METVCSLMMDERIKKSWHVYKIEYKSVFKKKENSVTNDNMSEYGGHYVNNEINWMQRDRILMDDLI